jgi:hypothetical protein
MLNYLFSYSYQYILNNYGLSTKLIKLTTNYYTNNNTYKLNIAHLNKLSQINNLNIKTTNLEYFIKQSTQCGLTSVFNKSNHNKLSLFESDKLDNTLISAENIRTQNTKNSVYLVKGVLNSNILSILQNNFKLNTPQLFNIQKYYTDIATKPSHVEQF